jgi:hypothetical protein
MATPLIMFAINMLLWFWHTHDEKNKVVLWIGTCTMAVTISINIYLTSAGITPHTSWLFIVFHPLLGALLWGVYKHLFQPLIVSSIQSFSQDHRIDSSYDSPLFDGGTQDMHQAETHLNMLNQQLYKIQAKLKSMQAQEKQLWTLSAPQQPKQGAQLLTEVEDLDNRLKWLFSSSFDLSLSCEKAKSTQVLHKYVFERLKEQLEIKMKSVSVLQNKTESLRVYLSEALDTLGYVQPQPVNKDAFSQYTPEQQAKAQAYWSKNHQHYDSLQVWQKFDIKNSKAFWQHYELMLTVAKSKAE